MHQRAQRRGARRRSESSLPRPLRQRQAGQQACGDALHVTFHARELPCNVDLRTGAKTEVGAEQPGRVDVSVAMDLAVAKEFRVLEAWDHSQDSLLLGKLQM